jgi:hypothetical protein
MHAYQRQAVAATSHTWGVGALHCVAVVHCGGGATQVPEIARSQIGCAASVQSADTRQVASQRPRAMLHLGLGA